MALRLRRLPEPRSGGEAGEMIESEHLIRGSEHELRLYGVECRHIECGEAHVYASGAEIQCSAPREHCCACHSGRAADDARASIVALVRVQSPAWQRSRNRFGTDDVTRWFEQRTCVECERCDVKRAAMVRAIEREKARLERADRHGVRSPH